MSSLSSFPGFAAGSGKLVSLKDVDFPTSVEPGEVLSFSADSGQWINNGVLDGGVSSANQTLSRDFNLTAGTLNTSTNFNFS